MKITKNTTTKAELTIAELIEASKEDGDVDLLSLPGRIVSIKLNGKSLPFTSKLLIVCSYGTMDVTHTDEDC